jgi:hypothetical protein
LPGKPSGVVSSSYSTKLTDSLIELIVALLISCLLNSKKLIRGLVSSVSCQTRRLLLLDSGR